VEGSGQSAVVAQVGWQLPIAIAWLQARPQQVSLVVQFAPR
jgi:hypothetical protein